MNSNQIFGSITRSIGMALVAGAVLISFGFCRPAQAASDYLLELDGVEGEISAKASELEGKLTDLQNEIAAINNSHSNIQSMLAEIELLNSEIDTLRKSGSDQQEVFLQTVADSKKLFEEQIAPLLDPQVVESVSLNFTKIEFEYKPQENIGSSDNDGVSVDLDKFSESLRMITDGYQLLQALSTEFGTEMRQKISKSRSNIQNN